MGGSLPAGATGDFTTPADKPFVASMGIYVFTRKALVEALAEANVVDFGHEIIRKALGRRRSAPTPSTATGPTSARCAPSSTPTSR